MRELFVYWRTPAGQADEAEHAVQVWHDELRLVHPTLRAALYRRADESAAPWVTLMEVYTAADEAPSSDGQATPAGIGGSLEEHLVREGNRRLARWIDGARKVEPFVRMGGRRNELPPG